MSVSSWGKRGSGQRQERTNHSHLVTSPTGGGEVVQLDLLGLGGRHLAARGRFGGTGLFFDRKKEECDGCVRENRLGESAVFKVAMKASRVDGSRTLTDGARDTLPKRLVGT